MNFSVPILQYVRIVETFPFPYSSIELMLSAFGVISGIATTREI